MSVLDAAVLGLVQGVTEFLPISSSGHLVIFQELLGYSEPGVLLEVALHLATILAVLTVFWADVTKVFAALGKWGRRQLVTEANDREHLLLAWLVVVGTIPAVLAGVALKSPIESAFDSLIVVGFMLPVTGAILIIGHRLGGHRTVGEMKISDALLIGTAQAAALMPGISRSGSTIVMALGRRVDPALAAKFSLLLSVPAVLGANVLELFTESLGGVAALPLLVGMAVAYGSGVVSIKLLVRAVVSRRLPFFAAYCVAVGSLIIVGQAV